MAITDINVIDFLSERRDSGEIILTISDHLDWTDAFNHLSVLQAKLNAYLEFIESGQVFESYPERRGRKLAIEIVSKYEYSKEGIDFLALAKPVVNSIGADLRLG